ncbi:MAG: hypothetical protein ABL956_17675, partial [Hyphomonadaceae bacterium]
TFAAFVFAAPAAPALVTGRLYLGSFTKGSPFSVPMAVAAVEFPISHKESPYRNIFRYFV